MSIHTDEFDVHICDDKRCGNDATCLRGQEDAPSGWYSGTVSLVDGIGQVHWSACKATHIRGAVEGAITDEMARIE